MGRWEYSSAPESSQIVSIDATYGLYIGGAFVDPASGDHFKTINPATEEVLAAVEQEPEPVLDMFRDAGLSRAPGAGDRTSPGPGDRSSAGRFIRAASAP
jgi:hypothetical protein